MSWSFSLEGNHHLTLHLSHLFLLLQTVVNSRSVSGQVLGAAPLWEGKVQGPVWGVCQLCIPCDMPARAEWLRTAPLPSWPAPWALRVSQARAMGGLSRAAGQGGVIPGAHSGCWLTAVPCAHGPEACCCWGSFLLLEVPLPVPEALAGRLSSCHSLPSILLCSEGLRDWIR